MDLWSEDSSDEYVRAEQEAALYSAVHYTHVEADNTCNDSGNKPNIPFAPALDLKAQSDMTQSIAASSIEKVPLRSSGLVGLPNQSSAMNFNSEKSSSVKTRITLVALPVTKPLAEQIRHSSNNIDSRGTSPHTFQKTKLDSNSSEINTFSLGIKNQEVPKTIGNNLFSPFNAQYLESKTSSKNVFRLDERLFLHEKVIGNVTLPSKPVLAKVETESDSKSVSYVDKTEAQKAFVFNLSCHSISIEKKSPQLNLTGSSKSEEPISAPIKFGVNKNKPPVPLKSTKKLKAKRKLEVLQSNPLYNSIVNLKSPADNVMVIGLQRPKKKCKVVVLDKKGEVNSVDPEVIVLDSDSDESVHVVPVPLAPLPVIISVEDSSDDDRVVRVRPAVVVPFETDPDVAENSFDFLDNVIENCMGDFDGMRKAQANVLSHLISNHSSKESLVDERLFQVEPTVPESEVSKKTDKLCYQDDSVSSSTSSSSPVLENDQSMQVIGNVESGSDTSEMKTPLHSFKVPKSKVRTKSRQAKNVTSLPPVIDVTLPISDSKEIDDDLIVLHSGNKSGVTIEEILSEETKARHPDVEVVEIEPRSSDRKRKRDESINEPKKKKKKPGKKKRAKIEKKLQKLCSRSHPTLYSYTKIAGDELVSKEMTPSRSPPSWTKEMRRFYNSSWGGEEHDWKKIRASMPGHPLLWQLLPEDRYPVKSPNSRAIRCRHCQRSGHSPWACPKVLTCRMCGQSGHVVKDCPNSICLKCGEPSREFVKWCWQCKGSPFDDCPLCVWQHHPSQPCRNYRERPSSFRPHLGAHAGYKGYRQRYGNNRPAERGFNPYYNKNFSRRPFR